MEIEKPLPYVGDIWVPTLHLDSGRSVKTYILWMEKWFRLRDKLISVEHAGVISRLLNWILEIGKNGLHQSLEEGEDHVDLGVFPLLRFASMC
jgi:hypothetical protein